LCLDLSAIIGHKSNNTEEGRVAKALMPLNARRTEFLLHPVMTAFIMIKYNSYAVFLWAMILSRLLFCVLMTTVAYCICAPGNITEINKNLTETNNSTDVDVSLVASSLLFVLSALMLIFCLVGNIVNNFRNLAGSDGILFHLGGMLLYASTLAFIIYLYLPDATMHTATTTTDPIRFFSSFLVLASWVAFTTSLRFLLLGRLYNLGHYIVMLTSIIKKVVVFLMLYFSLLIGFTFSFYMVLPVLFKSPFQFTRTIAMMMGEVEFGDNFLEEGVVLNILFFIFVIIVPVIINNLLIGLTVSDVSALLEDANKAALVFKLETIASLDDDQSMQLMSKILGYCFQESHLISAKVNSLEVSW
jgi:transient receptor potential cation channel subfamily A protein 1